MSCAPMPGARRPDPAEGRSVVLARPHALQRQRGVRHRIVRGLLAVHLPVVFAVALLTGHSALAAALAVVPGLVLLATATRVRPMRSRAVAAALGLAVCSVLLVVLAPDRVEPRLDLLVVVAAVALYQDRVALLLPLAVVVAAPLVQPLVPGQPDVGLAALGSAALQVALVLAEAAVLSVFWRAHQQARDAEDRLQSELAAGRSEVRERIEETERIRADLIGTVSHEFRTPLTVVRGAALTLLKHSDRLDGTARDTLLRAVLDQQERLSRLLENMLTAARMTEADPNAVAEVDTIAADVTDKAHRARPESPQISVVVEPGTLAQIDRQALHQVLANLVDNAQLYGAKGSVPLLAGGTDGDGVWVAVSNEGSTIDVAAAGRRLFEPFTQDDGSTTREHEGVGLGLHVVSRVVEVYGGSVVVRAEGSWVTVEVRLRSAASVRSPAAVAG